MEITMDCPGDVSSTTSFTVVVGEPNDYDVLLGRGNHVNYAPGNLRFRKLAAERSLAYITASTKKSKDAVAEQLMSEVTEKGGRFLRLLESQDNEDSVWEVVTGQIVSTKVRQAMRDTMKVTKCEERKPLPKQSFSPQDLQGEKFSEAAIAEKARKLLDQVNPSGLRRTTGNLGPHVSTPQKLTQALPSTEFEAHSNLKSVGTHQLPAESPYHHILSEQPHSNSFERTLQQHLMQDRPPIHPLTERNTATNTAGSFSFEQLQIQYESQQLLQHLFFQRTVHNQQLQLQFSQLLGSIPADTQHPQAAIEASFAIGQQQGKLPVPSNPDEPMLLHNVDRCPSPVNFAPVQLEAAHDGERIFPTTSLDPLDLQQDGEEEVHQFYSWDDDSSSCSSSSCSSMGTGDQPMMTSYHNDLQPLPLHEVDTPPACEEDSLYTSILLPPSSWDMDCS